MRDGVSGDGGAERGGAGGGKPDAGFTAEERGDTVGRTGRTLVRILIPVLILAGIGGTVIVSHGAPAALTGFVNGVAAGFFGTAPAAPGGAAATGVAATGATDAVGTPSATAATGSAAATPTDAAGSTVAEAAAPVASGGVAPASTPSPSSTSADQQWLDLMASAAATAVPSTTFSPYPIDPSAEEQGRLVLSQDARWSLLARGVQTVGMQTTGIVLPSAAPTTLDDLISSGMATRVDPTTVLITKTVFVARGATLSIDAPGQTIRLLSHAGEFMPIVVWGGELDITGTEAAPVTLTSWDPETNAPDFDVTDGRAYVRVNEGRISADHLDAGDLGFWSGETGGFALTGSSSVGSTGTIAHSTFSGQHFGLYLASVTSVAVTDSTVRDSDQEGIAVGANSTSVSITGTTVENSGGNGIGVGTGVNVFTVDSATLTGNGGYGLRFDGSPRATGENVGGFTTENSKVLTVKDSTVADNHSGGLSVIETSIVTISGNEVTQKTVGISLRDSQGEVTGNTVNVTNGEGIVFDGALTSARAEGNTLTGSGPNAIAQTNGADDVQLSSNTDSGWTVQWELLLWIQAHPLALLWALLLVIPVAGIAFVFYRRRRQRRIRELVESATIAVAKAEKERYELERGGGAAGRAESDDEPDARRAAWPPPRPGNPIAPAVPVADAAAAEAATTDPVTSIGAGDAIDVGDVSDHPSAAAAPVAAPASVVTAAAVVVAKAVQGDAAPETPDDIRQRLGTSARVPGMPAKAARTGRTAGAPAATETPSGADAARGAAASTSAAGFGRFSSVEELAVASVLDAGKPIDRVATALRVPVGSVAGWVAKARRARAAEEERRSRG
ncbi:right-handed parallel beta-helix repeat-containing protein [Herbiconiux sp. 11R-BC]|uniref:right-handed parallel beta-helix repeat-containing protein n=1 Tax=Herbiconiux sp. 11R-BC TaxID=3111637 RepID=UPI003C09107A